MTRQQAGASVMSVCPALGAFLLAFGLAAAAFAQDPPAVPTDDPDTEAAPAVPESVEVDPVAEDEDIATRLTRILEATEWFEQTQVRVDEGVVFLRGRTQLQQHKEWAGQLAGKTQDVVAVVNRIQVIERSMWDLSPAWQEVEELAAATVQNSPLILVAAVLLIATWFATRWASWTAAALLDRQLQSKLLKNVVARAVAVPVFLLGLYLVLKVAGLTRLAMTVLGGTGLIGLVIGFAFRDIAENFLASILISIQNPFASGDLVEVAGCKGFVQSVNTRSTLLMTLDGNHVQIPNATIYKETITNFTANPNERQDFSVGIGYDDSIPEAQSIALQVLRDHPAVIEQPESLVLVEGLGAATVNLRVFFWVDISRHSALKVRSAVVRLVKQAFDAAGVSMPDEAREVVFPAGVPVEMISREEAEREETERQAAAQRQAAAPTTADESAANDAEGDLSSEADEIQQQAQQSRNPESGPNLLE